MQPRSLRNATATDACVHGTLGRPCQSMLVEIPCCACSSMKCATALNDSSEQRWEYVPPPCFVTVRTRWPSSTAKACRSSMDGLRLMLRPPRAYAAAAGSGW
jgi:hypothetical protein